MAEHDTPKDEGRRHFLKFAAVAAPAAATGGLATEAAAETAEPQGSGLRKTAHVKAYLDSARF